MIVLTIWVHFMIALKAKYNQGKIDWEKPPPFQGSCDLIVIFSPLPETKPPALTTSKRRCIDRIQKQFANIPREVSLVGDLIAERRREAARD